MTDFAAVVRFIHLAAAVLLAGSFSFALLIARPAFLTARFRQNELPGFYPATGQNRSLLLAGDFPIGLTRPLDPGRQRERELSRRRFQLPCDCLAQHGNSVRQGVVGAHDHCLLLGLLLLAQPRQQDLSVSGAVLSGGALLGVSLLITLAFAGHASAADGSAFVLQVSSDALHLLATGLWLGGLPPLATLLHQCRRQTGPDSNAVARIATRRFSALAIGERYIAHRQRRLQCLESRRRFCAVVRHGVWTFVAAQARPRCCPCSRSVQ